MDTGPRFHFFTLFFYRTKIESHIVGHEVRIVLENKKKADAIIQAREKTVITTYFDALILCKADGTVEQGGFW